MAIDYDSLIQKVGDFGRFQILAVTYLSALLVPCVFQTVGIVFIIASPDHWCSLPELEGRNLSIVDQKNFSLPLVLNQDGKVTFSHCEKFANLSAGDATVSCSDAQGWEYDTSQYASSVVMDWDLVCDKKWFQSLASSIYMAGMFIGVIPVGYASDRFGRKKTIILGLAVQILSVLSAPLATNYVIFLVCRFFMGLSMPVLASVTFILAVEIIGPDWRAFVGVYMSFVWAGCYIVNGGVAYFIREWKWLQVVYGVPLVVLAPFIYFIPESPRWLFTQDRSKEAEHILKNIARWNGKALPADRDVIIEVSKKAYPWHLLGTPRMRWVTIILSLNWFVCALVYYGLSLNTSNWGGNHYVNFIIAGVVEFPAYAFTQFGLKYLGRRWTAFTVMLGASSILLVAGFIPSEYSGILVALSSTGKFFISSAFSVIYIYGAELMPTVVRSAGVGMCNLIGRVGSVIAPFIGQLGDYGRWIPTTIFAVLAMFAGLAILFVPETKGAKLPETLQDGETFGGEGFIPKPFFSREASAKDKYMDDVTQYKAAPTQDHPDKSSLVNDLAHNTELA